MQKWWVRSGAVIIVIAASVGFLYWQMSKQNITTLELKNRTYQLKVVQSEADREQGLSGTSSLPDSEAMLFVFPAVGRPGIWMKDMKYAIDIVWLDSDKRVVYMVKNAQPSSYPNMIFQTDKDSRYVIELTAGTIEKTDISQGDIADFNVIN